MNRAIIVSRKYIERIKARLGKEEGIPTDSFKVGVIREYTINSGIRYFIETGTYRGKTTEAVHDLFTRLHTIELDPYLHRISTCHLKQYPNITCHKGDSAEVLNQILQGIDDPVLYWLDAHYSRGITEKGIDFTPIVRELEVISKHRFFKQSIILIDDARDFTGREDYPTIPALHEWIQKRWPECSFAVKEDIIRICP